ncbi:Acetylornithine aminotransferase [Venturia nashicola]|uniref:Acetylornithine aminotransferase n=1 Tax=Venturia nashicola TaxID=86259 RepID=A0A4Z1P9D3_9PEZI|nr:Acetylornithine aminotransferase [Venturia nashicola]TLD37060.1 Acetylornithine aminotransferase [Venturia nashicola]
MKSPTSPNTVKTQASAGTEINDNGLFFVDLNPIPITSTLPYPAFAGKNEIVDLIGKIMRIDSVDEY